LQILNICKYFLTKNNSSPNTKKARLTEYQISYNKKTPRFVGSNPNESRLCSKVSVCLRVKLTGDRKQRPKRTIFTLPTARSQSSRSVPSIAPLIMVK
jgi:hypothetical protein